MSVSGNGCCVDIYIQAGRGQLSTGGKYVHVVEDDPGTAELVGFVAQTMGYRPVYAGTVARARSLIEKAAFCLILLDIGLPDGNGMELCRWLRTINCHTPVLIHTGNPVSPQEARAAGADDIIHKSSEAMDRLQDVVRLLARRECPGL